MTRKVSKLTTTIVASLLFTIIGLSVVSVACNGTYSYVYVYNKNQPYPWIGVWFGNYYAGAFYVDLRTSSHGNNPGPYGTVSRTYCIDYDGPIYIGREYKIDSLPSPPNNADWKKIAYLLTWYDPPANNDAGVCLQGALWKILDGIIPSFISSYTSGINALVSEATNKDVVRAGDNLVWVQPLAAAGNNTHITANPGETVTLVARLTNGGGTPRSGVKVEFSTAGGGSLNTTVGWTNGNGEVGVKVTVPNNAAEVSVKAKTRGVWPQHYVYFLCMQDLLCHELTTTTNLWIITYIHVVPELPFGTLAAIVTCFFAYKFKTRKTGRIN